MKTHSDIDVRKYFNATYKDKKASEHEWTAGTASPELIKVVWNNLIEPGSEILEVGCGLGSEAIFLAVRGMNVSALDISEAAIRKAQKLAETYDVEVNFQVGDALKLPFENESFDVYCDQGCFHHLTDEERLQYRSELLRVLKPKGLFLLRSFSDKIPGNSPQPRRIKSKELIETFSPFLELEHLERVLSFTTPQRHMPLGWHSIWYKADKS